MTPVTVKTRILTPDESTFLADLVSLLVETRYRGDLAVEQRYDTLSFALAGLGVVFCLGPSYASSSFTHAGYRPIQLLPVKPGSKAYKKQLLELEVKMREERRFAKPEILDAMRSRLLRSSSVRGQELISLPPDFRAARLPFTTKYGLRFRFRPSTTSLKKRNPNK